MFFNSLTKVVRKFAEELDSWLKSSIAHLPDNLKVVKLESKCFSLYFINNSHTKNETVSISRVAIVGKGRRLNVCMFMVKKFLCYYVNYIFREVGS